MIWEQWQRTHNFGLLADRTKDDYLQCSKRPIKAFKGWDVSEIEPPDVFEYVQKRGKESIKRANYELTWLNHVLRHAVAMGFIDSSPSKEIQPLKSPKKKKSYVSDFAYLCMLAKAAPAVRVAMEISYCTGMRQGDVLKLRWDDISSTIYVEEGKTGHEYSKLISDRLQMALEAAKKLPGHRFGGWVVRNGRGGQYTSMGFRSNFRRAKLQVLERRRFTFHDIRHKAITDAKGDKQAFSMHSDARMLGIYDHELPVSPSH